MHDLFVCQNSAHFTKADRIPVKISSSKCLPSTRLPAASRRAVVRPHLRGAQFQSQPPEFSISTYTSSNIIGCVCSCCDIGKMVNNLFTITFQSFYWINWTPTYRKGNPCYLTMTLSFLSSPRFICTSWETLRIYPPVWCSTYILYFCTNALRISLSIVKGTWRTKPSVQYLLTANTGGWKLQ